MTGMTAAESVRDMGLSVGDTIEGQQVQYDGTLNTVRMTLLWVGESIAVWRWTERYGLGPWSRPEESATWDLSFRTWRKVDGDRSH